MFSRLLRILMFMFFFSFSSFSPEQFSRLGSFVESNEFDAIKNMLHKRITADIAFGKTRKICH
jgi:hypothetical protein